MDARGAEPLGVVADLAAVHVAVDPVAAEVCNGSGCVLKNVRCKSLVMDVNAILRVAIESAHKI